MSKSRRQQIFALLFTCMLGIGLWTALPANVASSQMLLDPNLTIVSVSHLALNANDIIYDPHGDVIYASLPSHLGENGNRIVPVAVPDGTLGTPLFVGSEPNHMALSAGGEYLYVGLDGASAVRRVDLQSYTADIQIALGAGGSGGAIAEDMVVLQDDPHALAVSKGSGGCCGNGGVFIYDDETERPNNTSQDFNWIRSIEPSASPSILYGSDGSSGLSTLVITPTGVAISETTFSPYISDILYHEGLIYGSNGAVVDPQSMTLLGTYDGFGPFAVDSANGLVYMVTSDWDIPLSITVFDQTEFTKLKTMPLFNIDGSPERLLLVGPNQLAMLTMSGHLYLINLGERIPQPPSFSTSPLLTATEGTEYHYEIEASDPNYVDSLAVSAVAYPSWLQFEDYYYDGPRLYGYPNYENLGEHSVELVVTDFDGLTDTQKYTITVIANPAYTAPYFESTPITSAMEGEVYAYIPVARDDNGDYLEFTALVVPDWLTFYGYGFEGTPQKEDVGDHAVELRVTDDTGRTDTQQFTITVAAIPTFSAPAFTSAPELAAADGAVYSYDIVAEDADPGDILTISAPVLPGWLALEQLDNGLARLNGTPAKVHIGNHAVKLFVTDSHGLTATQEFILNVVDGTVNLPPTIGSTPSLVAVEASTYSYIIVTTDPNPGELLTLSTPVLPSWLSFELLGNGVAVLQGTPAKADIGTHEVAILVTDSHGITDTQTYTIEVVDATVNLPPTIGSTPPLVAAETITYSYIITAADPNLGDLLTFSAPVLPSWLELVPLGNGAALLQGVATKADIGEHAIELLVTDSEGLSATQEYTLNVIGVGQVQGILFDDTNSNGFQDEEEPGIAGATVSLTPEAESMAAMVLQQAVITTTTNETGAYAFTNVPTGNYVVDFDLPGDEVNPAPVPVNVTGGIPKTVAPVAKAAEEIITRMPIVKVKSR